MSIENFWEKQIAILQSDIAALEDQLSGTTLSADRNRLRRLIENSYKELEEYENQLNQKQKNKYGLDLKKVLQNIDFQEATERFEAVCARFPSEGGSALFLMNNCYNCAGDILARKLCYLLSEQSLDFRHYPIEIKLTDLPEQQIIYTELQNYFSESSVDSTGDLIDLISNSVQNGTTILFEFRQWDDLDDPCAILDWFLKTIWIPLSEQRQKVCLAKSYRKVRFLGLITCECEDEDILNLGCLSEPHTYDPSNISQENAMIPLPLQYWSKEEIEDWLYRYPPPKYSQDSQILDRFVKKVYRNSRQGEPRSVVDYLEKEILSNFQ